MFHHLYLKLFERTADDSSVKIIEHDLSNSLPYDESFEGRSFDMLYQASIHHLTHERKRSLYSEIFPILNPNGIFCNLDMYLHLPIDYMSALRQNLAKHPKQKIVPIDC
jgi:predicted SAM-dependent methyltransferase